MKKEFLIIILLLVLVLIVGAGCKEKVNYDEFAKCLTSKKVKMYGAYWCPHCAEQKKDFDNSWKYVNYVECAVPGSGQTEVCLLENIRAYPTWDFNGERIEGKLSFEVLAEKSGCELSLT